jgi:hypothetical protein
MTEPVLIAPARRKPGIYRVGFNKGSRSADLAQDHRIPIGRALSTTPCESC